MCHFFEQSIFYVKISIFVVGNIVILVIGTQLQSVNLNL